MAVEFGMNIPIEPIPQPVDGLLDQIERLLPALPASFKSLWVTVRERAIDQALMKL